MFPTVTPLAPWEGSALLSNTCIAAGLPNTAKLDRLTYLETVVANLLLGQPATLGLAALPPVKTVLATPTTRPNDLAEPGDFTGAHFVALTYADDASDDIPAFVTGRLATRTACHMVDEIPHVVPGDTWLVLVTNATPRMLVLQPGPGVKGGADIPPGVAQLLLVTVTSLVTMTVTRLLAGQSTAAVADAIGQ